MFTIVWNVAPSSAVDKYHFGGTLASIFRRQRQSFVQSPSYNPGDELPGISLRVVHVQIVVEQVAIRKFSLQVIRFLPSRSQQKDFGVTHP
jgi:hypothetical protein